MTTYHWYRYVHAGTRAMRQLLSPIHQLSEGQDADWPRHRGPRQCSSDAARKVFDARRRPLLYTRSRESLFHFLSLLEREAKYALRTQKSKIARPKHRVPRPKQWAHILVFLNSDGHYSH